MAAPTYVINGFYMTMREKFTTKDAKLQYFVVEWDSKDLSWEDFRGKVLGTTDPASAVEGSLRRTILDDYKTLGLAGVPNVGDNGVHASASPFEALAERMNWLGAKLEDDAFGQALLANVDKDTIVSWLKDPQVELDGEMTSLFDCMEDQNSDEILAKANKIAKVQAPALVATPKNQAFVFIKPHAVTDAVKALVSERFSKDGFSIVSQGELTGPQIDEGKLIDNHYYSIAAKATLSKPADLNPPAAKQQAFAELNGLTWKEALDQGLVFNASDACKKLGLTADELNAEWAQAKKDGRLVKFGGGFYCGRLEVAPKACTASGSSCDGGACPLRSMVPTAKPLLMAGLAVVAGTMLFRYLRNRSK